VTRLVLPSLLRVASFRFAALYVVLFAASALVVGIAVFLEARSALEQQMTARTDTETAFLQQAYRTGGLPTLLQLVRSRGQRPGALDYLVQGPGGTHLAGEMPASAALAPGWTVIAAPLAPDDDGHQEIVRARVTRLGDGVLLAVGSDLRQISNLEDAIASAFSWTIGLAALLGIGGGALLSRTFLRRVDAIVRTAEAIIGGDLSRRVPLRNTGDDLDRLSATLNRMLDRINMLMTSLRQVSGDVAHDLRTPLTRLYQRLEEARRSARTVGDCHAAIDGALAEADALLTTFAALLRIAQVEGAAPRRAYVDLSAIAESVCDAYRPDAEEAGHRLEASVAANVTLRGDRELLTQALANLVENALRHTPSGTGILVQLSKSPEGTILSVSDDGPGVAQSDLSRLTQRFYRGQQSRTGPGNGLGLSLVSAIADLHDARLVLDMPDEGLRARIMFPPPTPADRTEPHFPLTGIPKPLTGSNCNASK
jgi:signal transduction histidine kinase